MNTLLICLPHCLAKITAKGTFLPKFTKGLNGKRHKLPRCLNICFSFSFSFQKRKLNTMI